MLFTAHINITTLIQQEYCQSGNHEKPEHNFPHLLFSKKQAPGKNDEGLRFYKALQTCASQRPRMPGADQSFA